jgi:hypothetical protein
MFKTRPISSNATTKPKLLKPNNVLINVIIVIATCSDQLEQHELKEREPVKAKGIKYWQQEKCLQDSFIEIVRHLQHGENDKQPTTTTKEPFQSNWVGLFDNSIITQVVGNNQTNGMIKQLVVS